MNPYRKDLTGRIFGKLIVIEYAGKASDGASLWFCRCNACSTYKEIRAQSLMAGTSQTCGCSSITHGFTRGPKGCDKPPEYKAWSHIKGRTLNPNNAAYSDYGGRGITVCDEWKQSFPQFLKDMGPRPSKNHSVERINNNGNYEPGNCKWGTRKEQAANRRSSRLIHADGRTQTLTEWAIELKLGVGVLWSRLDRGWSVERSLNLAVDRS